MLINNSETPSPQKTQRLVPAKLSESFMFPEHARRAFHLFPPVIRRVTDVFRARAAVKQLRLPPLEEDLVVEALTLPCATAGYNNQRLETLGDTVLKLCVVVHLFNAYPFRHEGTCFTERHQCFLLTGIHRSVGWHAEKFCQQSVAFGKSERNRAREILNFGDFSHEKMASIKW